MKSLPRARAPASAPELGRLQKLSQLSRPQAARFPEAASQRGGPSQVSCPGAAGPLSLGQEEAALARQCDGCLVASPHEGTSSFLPPQHRKQPQAPRSSGPDRASLGWCEVGFYLLVPNRPQGRRQDSPWDSFWGVSAFLPGGEPAAGPPRARGTACDIFLNFIQNVEK